MNKSLITGLVIGAAVVTAGAAVANLAVFDRSAQANLEVPAAPTVAPVVEPAVEPIVEPIVEPVPEVIDNTPKFADVLNVDPVTKTTRKPRQVCKDEVVTHTTPPQDENRIAGTVIGAVVGGVLGNQVGDGRGKKLATAAGAAAGGFAGNKVQERMQAGNTYTTTETRCDTVYDSSERIIGYNVRYRLGEEVGSVRMDRDPGPQIPVVDGKLQLAAEARANR